MKTPGIWNTGFVPAAREPSSRYSSRRHRAGAANRDPHFSLKWPATLSSSPLQKPTPEWEPLTYRHRIKMQKVNIYVNVSCSWGILLWFCFLTRDLREGRTRSKPQSLFVCRGNIICVIAWASNYLPSPTKWISENIFLFVFNSCKLEVSFTKFKFSGGTGFALIDIFRKTREITLKNPTISASWQACWSILKRLSKINLLFFLHRFAIREPSPILIRLQQNKTPVKNCKIKSNF